MAVEPLAEIPGRGARRASRPANSRTRGAPLEGWVALADRNRERWLTDLLPGTGFVVVGDRQSLVAALRLKPPRMLILVCPPAGRAEMRLAARERELRSGLRLVALSEHDDMAARLHALELGFDDAIDLAADPLEVRTRLMIAGQPGAGHGDANLVWVGPEAELDLLRPDPLAPGSCPPPPAA